MLMLPDFLVRQRDFLLEISRAITAQLDLSEVLRRVLNASVVMMAGRVGLIALRSSDDLFYVRAIKGLNNEDIPQINQRLHELISGLEDADGDSGEWLNDKLREMASLIDPNLQQSIALPLAFAGEPLGLLIVFRSYRTTVTANDFQVLQSFADQAAIAVHNAQLYERIDHERQRLQAILDHSADGVMIVDADLTILHFNDALARMACIEAATALGQHHDAVIQWMRLDSDYDLREALDAGWPFNDGEPSRSQVYVEGDLLCDSDFTVSVGITYAPMFTNDGKLANIVANVRDITNFRKAQEMQSVFISTVSHELKTPVAIIKGYAATLSREDAQWTDAIVRDTGHVIEEEADRLSDLIQNLLTASKLQAQRQITLTIGEVWLNMVAEQVAERFSKQTDSHRFLVHFPSDFPHIQGDETRLRQVLDNLVGNAMKYSPVGGKIKIGGERHGDDVMVYVRDEGVGIAERDQERIFDRFYRVDDALSRRTQGTGLGLYLSRAIIDAHNGRIGVKSQLGQGSTFFFTIPQQQSDER